MRNGDRFGAALAFDTLNLLVGAYGTDEMEKNVGAVYTYAGEAVACVADAGDGDGATDGGGVVAPTQKYTKQDLLDALKKQKEALDALVTNASSLSNQLGDHIQGCV